MVRALLFFDSVVCLDILVRRPGSAGKDRALGDRRISIKGLMCKVRGLDTDLAVPRLSRSPMHAVHRTGPSTVISSVATVRATSEYVKVRFAMPPRPRSARFVLIVLT